MPIRVLIADDHAVIRDGLKMIIEAQEVGTVVGMARDGAEAVAMAETLRPDVVLMDISMPELNGIEATRIIRGNEPSPRIIMLSMHHTSEHLYRAIQAGASGYLLKESAGNEVVSALRIVARGQFYFGNGVEVDPGFLKRSRDDGARSPLDSLSQRERQVMQLVVEGRTSAEIAGQLSLSPKSVETYRSRLMLKLGVANLPTLVKFALEHGITPTA